MSEPTSDEPTPPTQALEAPALPQDAALKNAAQAVADFDPMVYETEAESGFVFQGLLGILRAILKDSEPALPQDEP